MNAFKGYKLNTQGEGFMKILEHKRSPSKMGRHYSEIERYLAVNYQKPEFLIFNSYTREDSEGLSANS